MVRREQLISNIIIWTTFAIVTSIAFMTDVFAGETITLLAMVVILAAAALLATRMITSGLREHSGQAGRDTLRSVRNSYLPPERVERLVNSLDEAQLNELAWRLIYHDTDPTQYERIVREYEAS
ncbi:MAG: hypothetical protein D6737_12805 [Chloroflexi bacterium]|nr:MAG: hypothetical protein D6737_12805 [Chloroflexota bacterium]